MNEIAAPKNKLNYTKLSFEATEFGSAAMLECLVIFTLTDT
jgi:hypothetical protein